MLHIILTILKILGILLLVLLSIVLALVLAVLFVPFCYSAKGEKAGKEWTARAAFSWLFHLIHVRAVYEQGKTGFEVFLLGIPLLAVKRKLDRNKERRRAKQKERPRKAEHSAAAEALQEEGKNAAAEALSGAEQQAAARTTQEFLPEAEQQTAAKPTQQAAVKPPQESKSRTTAEIHQEPEIQKPAQIQKKAKPESTQNPGQGIFGKLKNLLAKILHFPSACMEKLKKIRLTFRGICDTIREWRTFIKKDSTKQAVRFLYTRGKGLLRHILPKKVRGNIIFGFGDPALTGQLLGIMGMLCPLYKNKLQMTPVFDRAVFEGEISLKGRIFVCYLLWTAWKVWRNKDVKVTYQRFQHKEA
ncbi:MAG: DUF2953 domain-containing protein [Clostridiales bacterium]|nr:DUF2953 domain-containing protein [Clostridiales bacterium]